MGARDPAPSTTFRSKPVNHHDGFSFTMVLAPARVLVIFTTVVEEFCEFCGAWRVNNKVCCLGCVFLELVLLVAASDSFHSGCISKFQILAYVTSSDI